MRTCPAASTTCVEMPSWSMPLRSVQVRRRATGAPTTPASGSVWNGRAGSISALRATCPATAAAHS